MAWMCLMACVARVECCCRWRALGLTGACMPPVSCEMKGKEFKHKIQKPARLGTPKPLQAWRPQARKGHTLIPTSI